MKILVEVRYPGIVPIHRQHVLGEVVAAHGKEIHALRELRRLIDRRRHLHHHAHIGAL